MAEFKITGAGYTPITCVTDDFIENYMVSANGDYVKIYLYLLCHAKNGTLPAVSALADTFQCTENDIKRALKYWESKGLLTIAAPVESTAKTVPEKHTYSSSEMKMFKEQAEIRQLFFVCEQYLGKQLTRTDIETLLYFYDQLHFSIDLIEYLVEYSVSKNKRSLRYMEAVALEWHKKGITTVDDAKLDSKPFPKECYLVLKALGINNHDPLPAEVKYVERWMNEFGFTIDIILEACNRTIMQIHKPEFNYTERILESWRTAGVRHFGDIEKLSAEHKNRAASKPQSKAEKPFTTRFHNFEQHTYDSKDLDKFFIN